MRKLEQNKLAEILSIEPMIYQTNPVLTTFTMAKALGISDKLLESALYTSKDPQITRLRIMYQSRGSYGPLFDRIVSLRKQGFSRERIVKEIEIDPSLLTRYINRSEELCALFGVEFKEPKKEKRTYKSVRKTKLTSKQVLSDDTRINDLRNSLMYEPCFKLSEILELNNISADVLTNLVSSDLRLGYAWDIYQENKPKYEYRFKGSAKRSYKPRKHKKVNTKLINSLIESFNSRNPVLYIGDIMKNHNLTHFKLHKVIETDTLLQEAFTAYKELRSLKNNPTKYKEITQKETKQQTVLRVDLGSDYDVEFNLVGTEVVLTWTKK